MQIQCVTDIGGLVACRRQFALVLLLLLTFVGSVSAAEPVWPGSNTRFYPGIYPYAGGSADAAQVAAMLDAWWGHVDRDLYREYYNGQRVSHIGLRVMFDPFAFFSPYWDSSAKAPFDYAGTCANSPLMQDPNAVVNGQPVYDWSLFDSILNLPEVISGEYKILFTYDDQGVKTPLWWKTQGMISGNGEPRKYDWIYTRMITDVLKAWATRYAGDSRIAGFELMEIPGIVDDGNVCGYVAPLMNFQQSAELGAQVYPAQAIVEADPGMMVFLSAPILTYNIIDGAGPYPGLDDVPGVQGIIYQDLRFFENTCGSGDPGDADCTGGYSQWQQAALVRNDLATGVHSDANGWRVRNFDRRTGDKNPWGVKQWPDNGAQWDGENVGGVYDGDPQHSAFADWGFWTWYTSGAPRAEGDAADSHLGQEGPDPAGVFASTHYMPSIPWCDTPSCYRPGDVASSWNGNNLSIERARKAFEIFGPSGTKAMFAYPKGYLAQFGDDGIDTAMSIADSATTSQPDAAGVQGSVVNLVRNGSFEDGKKSWGGIGTVVAEKPFNGSRSLRIKQTINEYWEANQKITGIQPGARYTISGYLRTDKVTSPAGASIHVWQYDAQGAEIKDTRISTDAAAGTTDYTKCAVTFTTHPNTASVMVRLRLNNAAGTVWFDDISLVAEAAPVD